MVSVSCGAASSSSSPTVGSGAPNAGAQSSGVPGSAAASRVTLRRMLIDDADHAPDPTRQLPPAPGTTDDPALRAIVVPAFERQRAAFAQCYQPVLAATADALGNVSVDIAFGPDGAVRDLLVRPEPVLEPARACLTSALRALLLTRPSGDLGVHAALRFQPHGAVIQESRFALEVRGHTLSHTAPATPRACVPLVLSEGYVTDPSQDEARRIPSLGPWEEAQRERLLARLGGLPDCYARDLARNPAALGGVQLRVVVGADGTARNVRADGPDMLHDAEACAAAALTGAQLCPGPSGMTTVLLTGIEFAP